MDKMKWNIISMIGLASLLGQAIFSMSVFATTATSPNYEITEAEFGAGATLDSCSGKYCAQATIGSLTGDDGTSPAGSTASFSSFSTDSEPFLEVIINRGESHLGVLTTDKTASTAVEVGVRSYLSNGYALQVSGDPPSYQQHKLSALTTPTASKPGKEQFGINAVKNTTPDVGADIEYSGGEGVSFGEIMPDYGTADLFMYRSGDDVAISRSETAETKYTISMIINVAGSTVAGHYSADFSTVIVPFF